MWCGGANRPVPYLGFRAGVSIEGAVVLAEDADEVLAVYLELDEMNTYPPHFSHLYGRKSSCRQVWQCFPIA